MAHAPLVPCPGCHRHARASAPCPFCGAALALPDEAPSSGPSVAATRSRIAFGVTVGTIAVTTALFGTACPAYGCPSGGCGDRDANFPDSAVIPDSGPVDANLTTDPGVDANTP
jgi:hypothetical protein